MGFLNSCKSRLNVKRKWKFPAKAVPRESTYSIVTVFPYHSKLQVHRKVFCGSGFGLANARCCCSFDMLAHSKHNNSYL